MLAFSNGARIQYAPFFILMLDENLQGFGLTVLPRAGILPRVRFVVNVPKPLTALPVCPAGDFSFAMESRRRDRRGHGVWGCRPAAPDSFQGRPSVLVPSPPQCHG
jgi:hypothetical protein